MQTKSCRLIALAAILLLAATVVVVGEGQPEASVGGTEYAGTDSCAGCHEDINATFMKSGHAWKLNKVVDGQPPDYPYTELPELPQGYTWNDISYVIGGYNWKARFIDKQGYIITGREGDTSYRSQYNFANPVVGKEAGWVTYHPGEKRVYNCGTCHTTGYVPSEEHQDNLPGLIGTWAEPGIRCEACHGPGSAHVAQPRQVKMTIDRDSAQCGQCHLRGNPESVNASGGFIKHHEQYEELFQSKHIVLDCVMCHDPHAGVIQLRNEGKPTARTQCSNCHFKEAKYQASAVMVAMDVQCIDCHMPRVTKSAWGDASKFTGDIRTHLMAIDAEQIVQFSEDGSTALSQLGLNFACRSCHVDGGSASVLTDQALRQSAYNYHARPKL